MPNKLVCKPRKAERETKMNSKLFILTATAALLASCGTQSNPATDYSDLNNAVPAYHQEEQTQGVDSDLFHLSFPDEMSFTEGVAKTYHFQIHSMLPHVSFDLQPDGLPQGISLKRVDATHFDIGGTVPAGANEGLDSTNTTLTIQVVNAKGDKQELADLSAATHTWQSKVTVSKTQTKPVVESQGLDGLQVNQGDSITFSVLVDDAAGSYGAQFPQLSFGYVPNQATGEVAIVNGFPGVSFNSTPQSVGNGQFKYTISLDTKALQIAPSKSGVTARIAIKFESPSGYSSAIRNVDIKVIPQAPAPAAAAPTDAASQAAAPAASAPQTPTKKIVPKTKKTTKKSEAK